jgi:membrane-associated phospholipid phosphatase
VAALSVSALRLYKDKHWMTNLLAGAVVGFLSTRVAYFITGKGKRRKEEKRSSLHVNEEGRVELEYE